MRRARTAAEARGATAVVVLGMGKRKRGRPPKRPEAITPRAREERLHPDIKRSIFVVLCFGLAIMFLLAAAGQAGPWGRTFYLFLNRLFGLGYYLLPLIALILGLSFLSPEKKKFLGVTLAGSVVFIAAGLGFIDILAPGRGGLTGTVIGSLKNPFGVPASLVITATALIASFLVIVNRPLRLTAIPGLKKKGEGEEYEYEEEKLEIKIPEGPPEAKEKAAPKPEVKKEPEVKRAGEEELKVSKQRPIRNYVPPPLSLLSSSVEKPTIGDLRANANIIKRTLESFGISVEMGEINVGPTVTRYTLKPAEGVKLSRITALGSDLALALAAHPIRIEAPIPGKSLVGIEVPNKAAAVVRLGNLLLYPEFERADPLTFVLGRNVSGDPVFPSIEKMPHMLVAGATGSGKSICIHSLLISLLYKNSPETLKLILIDPKRVELSVYDGIPHLIAPVVTDNKHAIGAFRWLIHEMERRYDLLLEAGARDVRSYHGKGNGSLPYILMVIDELADLMATYGHEVEGSIIRLAQMSRATGIHLVVSTQRPSVEVITGLIKANITTRIALQVASQVDSRTILDNAGAEKLLGNGDLLLISAERSKPVRIQGAFVPEEEVRKVARFIKEHNHVAPEDTVAIEPVNGEGGEFEATHPHPVFEHLAATEGEDELLPEAVELVRSAKKASASLLQRRLKVGYARAARLLDIMEEKGIVGPGEGAKPRDVYEGGGEEGKE